MPDAYTLQTRVAVALLATAPALALGIVILPTLPGAQKLWSLLAVGVTSYAANVARRWGNRVQPSLWEGWGGAPTTQRLRFRGADSPSEVGRRHALCDKVLDGCQLPSRLEEEADPEAADAEYRAAMGRVINLVREAPEFRLLEKENRNYGFARNLLGIRWIGVGCAVVVLAACLGFVAWQMRGGQELSAAWLVAFPGMVAVLSLLAWTQVGSEFVRRPAEAYADRVVEALDDLASRV